MPSIIGVSTALPPHRYSQEELTEAMMQLVPGFEARREAVERLCQRVSVKGRHLALPLEAYGEIRDFGQRNAAWLEVAIDLGTRAVEGLLEDGRVDLTDVGELMTTTVTGIAVPSLDAHLMNRLVFPLDTRRVPLFGLGCLAGVAGIARATDYLRGHPTRLAMLVAVELCSLTVQRDDASTAGAIAGGLFGDGAAAVLLAGDRHPLARRASCRVVDSRSIFFPNTERTMGWDVVETGFRVVLGPDVPKLARERLPPAVDDFLLDSGLDRRAVARWITHPGGPRVMDAMTEGLELDPSDLQLARESLAELGNMSSASVLFVLADTIKRRPARPGESALMIAMGPGFCAELVLLRWGPS